MLKFVNTIQRYVQLFDNPKVQMPYRSSENPASPICSEWINWNRLLEVQYLHRMRLFVSKCAIYLIALCLLCIVTACSADLAYLANIQASEDALPLLADVQGEVDFPLVSLSNSDYSLFSVQVIPGIEPGNEETKRVLMMYEGTDAVLILAQEPVSSQVEPPSKRIKGEVSNHELVQLEQAVATLVPQETGYALYWEKNGVSIALTGNIDAEDIVDLAGSLQ